MSAGGEWPQASCEFDAMEADRPDLTSSATTLASRSGSIEASIVWFRSILPRRDGSEAGRPLGETPAALKALSSRLPILSTLSKLPTLSATSSKGSLSAAATAAISTVFMVAFLVAPGPSARPVFCVFTRFNRLFGLARQALLCPAASLAARGVQTRAPSQPAGPQYYLGPVF